MLNISKPLLLQFRTNLTTNTATQINDVITSATPKLITTKKCSNSYDASPYTTEIKSTLNILFWGQNQVFPSLIGQETDSASFSSDIRQTCTPWVSLQLCKEKDPN